MTDKKLLNILACPSCRNGVKEDGGFLICEKCRKKYPVKNDIPVMLEDAAMKF